MDLELTGDLSNVDVSFRHEDNYTEEDLAKEQGLTIAVIDGEVVTNFAATTPPIIDIPVDPDPNPLPIYGRDGWGLDDYTANATLTQDQIEQLVDSRSDKIFVKTNKGWNSRPFPESQFRFDTGFSHISASDPTKNFGKPGAHRHTFFGNTLPKNEHTTHLDLLETGASVNQGGVGNRTTYYTPTMLDTKGNAVVPFRCLIYYKTKQNKDKLSLIPQGQGLISGNLTTGLFTPSPKIHWGFYQGGMVRNRINRIPASNPDGHKWFCSVVQFQDLLEAGNLEYTGDHKFSVNKAGTPVPAGHIQTYQLTMICFYEWEADTPSWHLDGDTLDVPGHSLHAEVRFAWNDALQQLWFDNCYRTNCSGGQVGIGSKRLNDFNKGNRYHRNLRVPLTT